LSRSTRLFIGALAFIILSESLFAAETSVAPFTLPLAREDALGGQHAALADDFSLLLSNPASLASAKPQLFAAQLGLLASGPIFDIANLVVSGGDLETGLVNLLAANDYKLYAGADLVGPLSFGYVGEGLGFGLFNTTNFSLNAASISSITVDLHEDILVAGGYAYRFNLGKGHALDLGLLAKGFVRGAITEEKGLFEIESLMDPSALLASPFTLTTGIGLDAGIRWNWEERVAAGLVCRDAYSPAFVSSYGDVMSFVENPESSHVSTVYSKIAPNLAFGASWSPELGVLGRYIDGFTLAADYCDILDLFSALPRNAILNVGVGAEVRLLEIMTVRLGIKEALLEAGMGFDLGGVRVGASAFGRELGLEPGSRPIYNLLLSLEFLP
jgi:hypothetical protein